MILEKLFDAPNTTACYIIWTSVLGKIHVLPRVYHVKKIKVASNGLVCDDLKKSRFDAKKFFYKSQVTWDLLNKNGGMSCFKYSFFKSLQVKPFEAAFDFFSHGTHEAKPGSYPKQTESRYFSGTFKTCQNTFELCNNVEHYYRMVRTGLSKIQNAEPLQSVEGLRLVQRAERRDLSAGLSHLSAVARLLCGSGGLKMPPGRWLALAVDA